MFQAERALARGNLVNLILGSLGDGNQPLTQREILDRAVQLIEKQFGRDPRIAIDLLLPIAGQYMSLGDIDRELAVMRRAGVIATASGDPALIANVACNTVETELMRGRGIDLAKAQLATGQTGARAAAAARIRNHDLVHASGSRPRTQARRPRPGDRPHQRSNRPHRTRGTDARQYVSESRCRSSPRCSMQRGDLLASYDTQKKKQRLEEHQGAPRPPTI